jgi:hypothetical protein
MKVFMRPVTRRPLLAQEKRKMKETLPGSDLPRYLKKIN